MKHYIIPVFIPHLGCRHQCIFCNQKKITGRHTPVSASQVAAMIDERLAGVNCDRWIEVAFFGGSFTALPVAIQNDLLAPAYQALRRKRIHAIRLSTRPDCISDSNVANLRRQGVTTVELGVQSLDDSVLVNALRGHSSQIVTEAVNKLKAAGLQCGLQLMPGLPGENWLSLLATVQRAVQLQPDFVRIYPTVVLADTPLADLYHEGIYQPLSLAAAVARSAYMKLVFEQQGISVIRTGLQATEELDSGSSVLAGPYHPSFGELVDSHLFYLMLAGFIEQNAACSESGLSIYHNPKDTSKIRGHYNRNITHIRQRYHLAAVRLHPDTAVKTGTLLLVCDGLTYIINKNMINLI